MANYDPYDYGRRYVREERREDRHADPRESYTKVHTTREIVPRGREDSDLSVEEVRRDFPPPTGRHGRPAEPGYYEDEYEYRRGYDSRYDRDDRRSRRSPGSTYYDDDERKSKPKGMSKQEKIIAAVAGAALLAGGKELFDRREAKEEGTEVQRNPLSSIALAGVGALAAYQGAEFYTKQQAKKDQKANYILNRGRDGFAEYYSDEDEGPKERKGHKNFLESALAATGLGAAVKTLTGGGHDHRSDTRSRRGGSPYSDRSRSRGGGGGLGSNKIQKAAMASLLAGATEAFRVSKEPGGWKGEKTKRILTAAAGAATVDAATDDKHGKLGLAESVIGGLVGNRLINGSKNDIEEDKLTGRSRSRSRARSKSRSSGGGGGSGLAALATAGLGALGAKKVLDRSRSRSRSHRGRDDSYSPSPERRRHRSRSRSVVDKARNSLAKLGLGGGAAGATEEYHRRDQDDFSDRGSHRSRRHDDDSYDDRRRGTSRDYYDEERSYRSKHGNRSDRKGGRSDYGSESDLGDSDEDERRAKKMKGKQIVTTGLAAVATIHAAHEVYQSLEKRNARHKAVSEGRLSEAKAKKLKTKAIMQDVASVGIAAMGIKGAFSELKEAKHLSHECKEFQTEKARRHEKRLQKRQRQPADGRSQSVDVRRRADSMGPSYRGGYDSDDELGPRYYGDNPYSGGSLPAPPLGGRW